MTHTPKIGDKFTKGDWTFVLTEEFLGGFNFNREDGPGVLFDCHGWLARETVDAITTWIKPTVQFTKEQVAFLEELLPRKLKLADGPEIRWKATDDFYKVIDAMIAPE